MSLWLNGIGISRGIAIGRVQRLHVDLEIPDYVLLPGQIESEIERFGQARQLARTLLLQVREQVRGMTGGMPGELTAFIDTHLLMLDDRTLNDAVCGLIRITGCNAESAVRRQPDALVAVFEQMQDAYLRSRKDDVMQVAARVLRALLHGETNVPALPAAAGEEPRVLVADDITPADIILLSQQGVAAIVTEYGGPLSHTAILARSLGLPAVAGLHDARRLLREGETVIVDGELGHVLADPEDKALAFFESKRVRQLADRADLARLRDRPAISCDGVRIRLLANVELSEDAAEAAALGAEGVGLYRTEFLFLNRREAPGEDEQYEAYASVVRAARGPITIRTLDLGADKQAGYRNPQKHTPSNPALGLRAIRLCLKEPELFRTQVRALLRAAVHGRVQIMLPMISSVQEFCQAQQLIDLAQAQLQAEGVAVPAGLPVGAMIEVPAAALAARLLARHARFFSIGTNDLIQYTLAIDRVDEEVNYLYDPLHPAVLSLIRMAIEAGEQSRIPVALCGEMAGDPRYTRLLLGLGLTEFSMRPASLLEVKRTIRESDVMELRRQARRLLAAESVQELQQLVAVFGH